MNNANKSEEIIIEKEQEKKPDNSREVELPIPVKKNDPITTGNNQENSDKDNKSGEQSEKKEKQNNPKKDAEWQIDKLNEANNQQGEKVKIKKDKDEK